jgi:NAD(P)-dependent dehydrogenase (short-subunit alcohol dehydrogenase family)
MSGRLGEMAEVAAAVAFLASADAAFVNATDLKVSPYYQKCKTMDAHCTW